MAGFEACRGFFNGMGLMGGGMWLSLVLLILIIAGITYLLVNPHRNKNDFSPLDILKHEYAKGKMSDDEFHRRKNNLMK